MDDSASLAAALADLGYPGFSYLRRAQPQNPATVLMAALAAVDLEARVVEALPWLVLEYPNLDWEWSIGEAKLRGVQNRLGFIVTLARAVAERDDLSVASRLRTVEETLEAARLNCEDTLCHASITDPERRWLRENRPTVAARWNLLTDLTPRLWTLICVIVIFGIVLEGCDLRPERFPAARAQIGTFRTALGAYKLDTGTFPTTAQGLQALRVKPSDAKGWQGPYLPQDVPKDPWGRDYLYNYPGEHGAEPDIISFGRDGQPGGEGVDADIVSWEKR